MKVLLLPILISIFSNNFIKCETCSQGKVLIDNICTNNDLTQPLNPTSAINSSNLFNLNVGQSSTDPDSLDFLVTTPTTLSNFFLVFSDHYLNSDVIVFTVTSQTNNNQIVVTATDSYFASDYPNLPVSDTSLPGGVNNIQLLGYQSGTGASSKSLTVKFSRKYITQDKYDTIFSSQELFLQRIIFGISTQESTQTQSLKSFTIKGSLYFILNTLTHPCSPGSIFNGQTCIKNDLSPLKSTTTAKFEANQFLTINYEVTPNNKLVMLLTAATTGYFGIAINGNSMSSVDMIVFNLNADNKNAPTIVICDDSYSFGNTQPMYDTALGGTYDISVLGYQVNTDSVQVKIERDLSTRDEFDYEFLINQETPFGFAFNNKSLTVAYHEGYTTGWGVLVLQSSDFKACTEGQVIINSQCQDNDLSANNLDQTFTYYLDQTSHSPFISIKYGITGAAQDEVSMLITILNVGWFGLGFTPAGNPAAAPTSMINSDYIIFDSIIFPNGDQGIYSQDAYSNSNDAPSMDTQIGGTTDVNLLGYSINNSKSNSSTSVKISRKLQTQDRYDYQFVKGTTIGIQFAWTDANALQFHGDNVGTDLLNFYQTQPTCGHHQIVVNGQCVMNNLELLPSSANDSFLDIQFDLSQEKSVTFMITVQNVGWFGIGFGSSMTKTDMIIISQNNREISAIDYYSLNDSTPSTDVQFGGRNDVSVLGYEVTGSQTKVKFSRLLDTGDKFDAVLEKDANLVIVYAWGSTNSMKYHGKNFGSASFPLQQGYQGSLTGIAVIDLNKELHFWVNFFVWGFAIDLVIIAARFGKTMRYYREVHGCIATLIVAVSIYFELAILLKRNILFSGDFSSETQGMKAHALIGFIFLLVIALEVFGGIILYVLLVLKKNVIRVPPVLKLGHQVVGYALYVLGKTNVIIGAGLNDDTSKMVAVIYGTLILMIFRLMLEYVYQNKPQAFAQIVRLQSRAKKDITGEESALSTSTFSLIESKEVDSDFMLALNSNKICSEIKNEFRTRKYVTLGNQVYDISRLSHPGGNFIFESINGRDVSRFLNGSYGLEALGGKGYRHSQYAEQLLKGSFIGEIQQPTDLIEAIHSNGNLRYLRAARGLNLSTTTAVFYLSDPMQKEQKFSNPKGLEWLGRHFTVYYEIDGVRRNRIYTNCLAFHPVNMERFLILQELFIGVMENSEPKKSDQIRANSINKGELERICIQDLVVGNENYNSSCSKKSISGVLFSLVIKKYESATGFSQLIHDRLPEENQSESKLSVQIEGPHGRGLELSYRSSGLHVIICGGTGVLPFFDLLVVFAKYVMFKALEKKHGVAFANQFDGGENQFSNHINSGFKLKVIAAFNNASDDCTALRLLEFIRKVDVENSLNLFDAVVSVKGYSSNVIRVDQGHFNNQYIERHLGNLVISRAFVCGPPAINKQVPLALKAQGLTDDQIMIV